MENKLLDMSRPKCKTYKRLEILTDSDSHELTFDSDRDPDYSIVLKENNRKPTGLNFNVMVRSNRLLSSTSESDSDSVENGPLGFWTKFKPGKG